MRSHVFGEPETTSNLLGTIATGIITITSITFSLLLLALQQSAGSLTHQVFDQFLRRRSNQVYFGFFVGMTLYTLITLATVNSAFNPVVGATVALILTAASLYLLLLLIYSTISQMRPNAIIKAIHDHTLKAREGQLDLLGRTRRTSLLRHLEPAIVTAPGDGFIVTIKLDVIESELAKTSESVEIEFPFSIGAYVAFQDRIAEVRAVDAGIRELLVACVERAIVLERDRSLESDPAYGIEQMTTIAWRSISTSQQNPAPGIAAINNLRDLLARWTAAEDDRSEGSRLPIVYPDNVVTNLFGAFESLAVVASESMQHQTFAAIVQTFTHTFDRLSVPHQQQAVDLVLRSLSALGDHVLTAELGGALAALEETMRQAGHDEAATSIGAAHTQLAASSGVLNSRATRVVGGS